jgi:hypothetical protein
MQPADWVVLQLDCELFNDGTTNSRHDVRSHVLGCGGFDRVWRETPTILKVFVILLSPDRRVTMDRKQYRGKERAAVLVTKPLDALALLVGIL